MRVAFVQRSRMPSSDPSRFGENARAASWAADVPRAVAAPLAPKSRPRIPARTVVLLGARDGATSGVEPLRTAIHTPRFTREMGIHWRIGWVTSYQVKPSARTGPRVNATIVPPSMVPRRVDDVSGRAR